MLCIHLVLFHSGYSNKLVNHPVPLVTHLLIPILMVLDVQTENALKTKNTWLVSFVSSYHGYP